MNTIIEFYQDLKHYSDRNVRLMALHEGLPSESADDLRWMLAVKHSHQKGEFSTKLPLPALVALAEQGDISVLRKYVVNKERLEQVLGALPLLMKTVRITKKQLREILLDDYKLFGNLSTPESIRIVKDAIFERCNEVVEQGDRRVYRLCGITHRDDDLPAIVSDAEQHWFKAGKRHRDGDRPAVVRTDGTQTWYKHGKLHRDNGPARIYGSTGDWYTNGKFITSKAIY